MRNNYDQIFKIVAEADPRGLLDVLGALPLDATATVIPLERELTRAPVYIDTAFEVEDERGRRIEHIEAFSRFGSEDAERVARYGNELGSKLGLPIFTTILLMVEAYDAPLIESSGGFVLGALKVTLEFRIVRLWEIPARTLLNKERPTLLQWIPLTNCPEEDWMDTKRALAKAADPQLTATFVMLGALRYGKEEWIRMLAGGLFMIQDKVFRENWFAQEWLKEGRQEGLERGREEGRLLEARTHIMELIEARFPELTEAAKRVHHIDDVETLHSLFSALLKAADDAAARELISHL